MAISFNSVPSNLRVPFVAVELDNSRAASGPALLNYRALLIGQKLASAPAAANSLHRVTSADDVLALCGRGSMLHLMALAYFAKNTVTETWIGVLADDAASVISSGAFTVSGTASENGTIYVYVGGKRVLVPVASGDSASTIAASMATEIGKHASGTVTFATAIATNTFTVGSFVFVGTAGSVTPGTLTFSVDTGNNAAAASAVAQVNAHAGASALVRASAVSAVMTLDAVAGGPGGNSIPLASSGSTLVVSGAALSGATDDTDLAVHASVSGAVATVKAMNGGAVANEIDLRLNYQDGESLPAGVSVAITPMASGANNPSLSSLIAAMGDSWYQIMALPYTDATSLTSMEQELDRRFGPMTMIDGLAFAAKSASYSTVATLGESRNSPHVSIIRTNASPTPPHEIAAHVAGAVALEGANDPAKPLQEVELPYVLAPAESDRDTILERNQLLFDGISTLKVGPANMVTIERLITTYQENSAGSPDESYLDVNTMLTLLYFRYSFRLRFAGRRMKLTDDGTRVPSGQAIMTPKLGKAECVAWFRDMEDLGLIEDFDQFKNDLIVERNVSNRNRLDIKLPPNVINQLITTGVQIQFIK